jgi:hypothetical protein
MSNVKFLLVNYQLIMRRLRYIGDTYDKMIIHTNQLSWESNDENNND